MSATLAVLLKELDPEMRLLIVERLDAPALESSSAINNAGTGHAANCELNYTPLKHGKIQTSKAIVINNSFEQSLELWASLTVMGRLSPKEFLHFLPHISFVWGGEDVAFLHQRYKDLKSLNAFSSMEWTEDKGELDCWVPLVMEGRNCHQLVAATRVKRGTDVDFGALTSAYLDSLLRNGAVELKLETELTHLTRDKEGVWQLELKDPTHSKHVSSPFVFLGAGGGALSLLQKSGIEEGLAYGGFPVSGQWLVCSDPELTARHKAKVYGKAKIGSPPMSVPHLDSRWIAGKRSLLFGPFAGFTTKFLKNGSKWDLFRSIGNNNFGPMLDVGVRNFDLVQYLLGQLRQNQKDRVQSLQDFQPTADQMDWQLSLAGQRVQIIKRTKAGGELKMGTEVVAAADGSLAALLGASPGASTAVTIMLEVLQRCWAQRMASKEWQERLRTLLPSFGRNLTIDSPCFNEIRERNDSVLADG